MSSTKRLVTEAMRAAFVGGREMPTAIVVNPFSDRMVRDICMRADLSGKHTVWVFVLAYGKVKMFTSRHCPKDKVYIGSEEQIRSIMDSIAN
jgi:hypothetical protein